MLRFRIAKSFALALTFAIMISAAADAQTLASLKSKLTSASGSIKDLRGTMVVNPANRKNAEEISKGILEFLDYGFREATTSYKSPGKFRAEGKAKGVDVTYVLNGNKKQIVAPAIMLRKNEDLSRDIGKKQSTLDMGFASGELWTNNTVRLLSQSGGVAKLDLKPKGSKTKRHELIWIETKTLKLIKRQRYNRDGALKSSHVYSGHKTYGKMPIAAMVKVYSGDGGYVGSITYKNLTANTGIADSMFTLK